MTEEIQHLSAWENVMLARNSSRTKAQSYINALFTDFMELHGDRCFGDDQALLGGVALFHGKPVTVLAQSKGSNLDENLTRNFGMMNPEGYRKALRLAEQAEKFGRPVITFVDTSGAYPGRGAEERGQASAIAKCLMTFSDLKVPVICIIIGEGGSGGALALSVADRLYMLEHAIYSVLSPEGFASILWKDDSRVQEAAEVMGLTAKNLYDKGIIDEIIQEPIGGIEICEEYVMSQLDRLIEKDLLELGRKKEIERTAERYKKFRQIGV
ncbi:MAG: acetyl-CoA carboxylase carboxyltransferase subunit alpha [Eubacterium sp.]